MVVVVTCPLMHGVTATSQPCDPAKDGGLHWQEGVQGMVVARQIPSVRSHFHLHLLSQGSGVVVVDDVHGLYGPGVVVVDGQVLLQGTGRVSHKGLQGRSVGASTPQLQFPSQSVPPYPRNVNWQKLVDPGSRSHWPWALQ